MSRTMKRLLSLLLSACVLLLCAAPALAAGDGGDPNVYVNKGVYKTDDYADTDSTFVFDPAAGTLTINDNGNAVPVNDEADFYQWIKSIAPGVKTVYIPKTSELENFSIGESTEEDIEFWGEDHLNVYPSDVFRKAFSYLYNLERFEVENGNRKFEAKDGVLYTRHCYDLVHYPAAKPDKTYALDKWCMMWIYPYAFCNTRYLERVELPYARSGNLNYMNIQDYAFSALDLDTGEEKESSIKQIVFYGTKVEFNHLLAHTEGNNAAEKAEIVSRPTDLFHDIITYIKFNFFITLRSMFEGFR